MKNFGIWFSILVLLLSTSWTPAQNANVAVADDADVLLAKPDPPARSTVRGRVYFESTGRPVRRASVMLMSKGNGRELSGLTDNNGNIEIKNVAAGTYYAFVNAPGVVTPLGYADLNATKEAGFGEAVENFESIVVNGITDTEVHIVAKQGGAISGRISYADGDPAIGVRVEVLRRVENRYIGVIPNFNSFFSMVGAGGFQTDDRGVYRFSGLPAGEYIIKVTESVSHSDFGPPMAFMESLFGSSSLLTVFYPDVFESDKARAIDVVPGQELYEINLTIPDRPLYLVGGKAISGKDRSPITEAKVTISEVGKNTISPFDHIGKNLHVTRTDEEGNWYFKEIPKGKYRVTIEPNNQILDYSDAGVPYPSNNYNSKRSNTPSGPPPPTYAKKAQEITITDKNISELVIELGYGAKVSGTVITENSKKMPASVNIALNAEEGDFVANTYLRNYIDESEPKPARLNPNFKLENVAEGKFRLYVDLNDDDFYVKSATLNNSDILGRPIELKEGDVLKNIRIVLATDVGTIKGRVRDINKQPGPNKKFALVPVNPVRRRAITFYRYVTSDEEGGFTVKAAPDEYAVVIFDQRNITNDSEGFYAWLDQVIKDAEKVTVKAGETSTVTFTVQ